MNPKVDDFLLNTKQWHDEFEILRRIILECPLTEELKWGKPCYTFQDNNIVLIHGFKDYCAVLFIKGALLKDPEAILIAQTENVQAGRQIRYTNAQEIIKFEHVLKSYILDAIELEKSGVKISFKKTTEFAIPDEFQTKLTENSALKTAFEALTPGRQRAYVLFFAAAKLSKTRESRIEKSTPQILAGKGLDD